MSPGGDKKTQSESKATRQKGVYSATIGVPVKDVPLTVRHRLWFLHARAPAYNTRRYVRILTGSSGIDGLGAVDHSNAPHALLI